MRFALAMTAVLGVAALPTIPGASSMGSRVRATLPRADAQRAGVITARTTGSGSVLPVCTAHMGRQYVSSRTLSCADPVRDAVRAWSPDVIVALGGGVLPTGRPGCATIQRAVSTLDLYRATGSRARIVLSGRGPMLAARHLDGADIACIRERAHQSTGRFALAVPDLSTQSATSAAMTEADHLCATMLRLAPAPERSLLLGRMRFEPTSTSTIENARRATPILTAMNAERVLIVTTFAFPRSGAVDNHSLRALAEFRAARRGRAHYRLASVACPFEGGGSHWISLPHIAP